MIAEYRSIFLSDIHLGSSGCQADYLLAFLREHECEQLYLVGDIIDIWQLKKGFYWPQSHNDVVQKVLRKARKGTRVVYIPGNHDEAARQYCGLDFGGIAIRREAEHLSADGKRLLIMHGDEFDGVMQHARWLAYVGDSLYTFTLFLNRHLNRWRRFCGQPYWSLSQYLKHKVKNAVSFISDFENLLQAEARARGFDGVICGHIHKAELRYSGDMLYGNCGDWVESLSALVEHHDGRLEIVHWHAPQAAVAPQAASETEEEQTCAS